MAYLDEPLKVRWFEAYFPWTSALFGKLRFGGRMNGWNVVDVNVQQQVLFNSGIGEDKIS